MENRWRQKSLFRFTIKHGINRAPIDSEFFRREPLTCARELVGCELRWRSCAGVIVETEAYNEIGDEACHAFFRPSARAFIARNDPGAAYVYFNYGMHWMLNVLVKGEGTGFVLIRALEPTKGIQLMRKRRGVENVRALCSGPGKLTRACGITGADHERDLCADERFGFLAREKEVEVVADKRIGISRAADLPWRFTLRGSAYVSRAWAGRARVSRAA